MSAIPTHVYQKAATDLFISSFINGSNGDKLKKAVIMWQLDKDAEISNAGSQFYSPYLDIIRKLSKKSAEISLKIQTLDECVKTLKNTLCSNGNENFRRTISEKLKDILGDKKIQFMDISLEEYNEDLIDKIQLENQNTYKFVLEYILDEIDKKIRTNKSQSGGVTGTRNLEVNNNTNEKNKEIERLKRELNTKEKKSSAVDLLATLRINIEKFEEEFKEINKMFKEGNSVYYGGIGVVDEESCEKYNTYKNKENNLQNNIIKFKNSQNENQPNEVVDFFTNIMKYYVNLLNMQLYYAEGVVCDNTVKDKFLDFNSVSQKIMGKMSEYKSNIIKQKIMLH